MTLDNMLFNQLASEKGLHYLQRHYEITLSMDRRQYTLIVTHKDGGQYEVHRDTKGAIILAAYQALNLAGDLYFRCKVPLKREIT